METNDYLIPAIQLLPVCVEGVIALSEQEELETLAIKEEEW